MLGAKLLGEEYAVGTSFAIRDSSGGCAVVRGVRIDHDAKRQLLQVRHQRLQLAAAIPMGIPQAINLIHFFGFKTSRKNAAKPARSSSWIATRIIASYVASSGNGPVSIPLISRKSAAACTPVRLFPSR